MVKLGFGSSSDKEAKHQDKKEGSIGVPEAANSELNLELISSCSSDGGDSCSLPLVARPSFSPCAMISQSYDPTLHKLQAMVDVLEANSTKPKPNPHTVRIAVLYCIIVGTGRSHIAHE
jgi:hypothetical protein